MYTLSLIHSSEETSKAHAHASALYTETSSDFNT